MTNWKTRRVVAKFLRYMAVGIAAVLSLFPIFVMVTTSFKTRVEAFSIPPVWFFVPTLENYIEVLFTKNFLRYFINSVIVGFSTTVLSVMIGALSAYALARFKFIGKRVVVASTLLLRMVPPVILVIPMFILWNKVGLGSSRAGLIIAYIGLTLPFNVWLLRAFIDEIPVEIEESAMIDGCSEIQVFPAIVLPLIKPALAVASVFTFRTAWNEFIISLVLSNRYTRTLPVAISLYLTEVGIEWGQITAIAVIIAIPAFFFTFVAAKDLIRGLTAGAVKG